jgi:hypothetical protein
MITPKPTRESEMGETDKRVDVLERILNCGEGMRDVHDAVAALIEADIEFDAAHLTYSAAKTGKPRNDAWARVLAAMDRRNAAMKRTQGDGK